MRRKTVAVLGLSGALTAAPTLAVQLNLGDILVADDPAGSTAPARILRFNPSTRESETISTGGFLDFVSTIALDSHGQVLATCGLAGVVKIDPVTGTQTIVSGGFFEEGLGFPRGLNVLPSGQLIVTTDTGRIVQVDPITGSKTTRATLSNSARGVARREDDLFIVSNPLQRMDLLTGVVTPVPSGGILSLSNKIAIDNAGYGYVTDLDSGIVGVDLDTGEERIVASGDLLLFLADLKIGQNNRPVVAAQTGEIFEVDPDNFGEQILITAPGQQLGNRIVSLEIVTAIPTPSCAFSMTIAGVVSLSSRRRRGTP